MIVQTAKYYKQYIGRLGNSKGQELGGPSEIRFQ